MKKIPLSGKAGAGMFALVDDEDFERMSKENWCLWKSPKTEAMYATGMKGTRKNHWAIKMHRMVMNAKPGELVDHRDGDGLNNQKSNLRICTKSENMCNKEKQKNNGAGFKGVKKSGKSSWVARVVKDGVSHYSRHFKSKIEAAKAANELMKQHHGEFARLNVIPK